ncbi:transposable element Tc1 transposase [Trichonephila clavipes]|nr:transposable element Tc1 transposase [Trichonephila clavipes]
MASSHKIWCVTVENSLSYNRRSSLVIIHTSLTAICFVDTILQLVVLSFMTPHQEPSYHQDNARTLIDRTALDCLQAVYTLPWSGRSSDLRPIKQVGNIVRQQIRPFQIIADLVQQPVNSWQNV